MPSNFVVASHTDRQTNGKIDDRQSEDEIVDKSAGRLTTKVRERLACIRREKQMDRQIDR